LNSLNDFNKADKIDSDAKALVVKLDGLPLALSTAGAYLEHVTTSFAEYLRLYEASWSKLQRTSPSLSSYEDRSLYTTWQVTFDRIRKQNAASAQLLKLWAYFDKQDVWFGLLRHAYSADYEWIQKLIEDELSFTEAVRLLCEYGLAHLEPSLGQPSGSAGYGMHSCVHSWTIYVLNGEWDQDLARLALICVAYEIPDPNADEWWLLQKRLLQHAARHERFGRDRNVSIGGVEWALHKLGNLYINQGKLAEAEAMYSRALQGKEEALGPKHTSTVDTVNNLGLLYAHQGKLAEAEAMYSRALQGYEEALGPKHTSTLQTVNNLGLLYADQGKLAEAEAMYSRALQGCKEALGPKHTLTLIIVNNLGLLYADQGKLAEAEAMFRRALQGYEEALEPKHTLTLQTVNNLGLLYAHQGKLAEAEAMYSWALQGYEEALGLKHTSTLNTVDNLGLLYADQGKLAEAEAMYSRALQGKEEALGPKHTLTLQTVNNLGNLYIDQGKLAEAEAMYSRALQGYEEAIGPELLPSYLPALNTMYSFGDLLSQTGREDKAKLFYSQALAGFTAVQGPSSKWCKPLTDRLQALQVTSVKPKEGQGESTEIKALRLRSVKRLFRKLGGRLHAA
jgi:tetratricopeptide (TPR) repeat protein